MRSLIALLFSCTLAFPATWYVSTTGNDTTGTGAIGSPFRTIAKGLLTMSGGDTLILRGGNYEEAPICDHSTGSGTYLKDGTAEQPTIIKSYSGERAALFSTNASCASGHGVSLGAMSSTRPGPKYIIFDGFTIDNSKRPCWSNEAQQQNWQVLNGHFLTLTNMHFLNTTNGSQVMFSAQYKNTNLPPNARWGMSNIITSCLFSNILNVDINGDGIFSESHHPIYSYPCGSIIVENSVFRYGHAVAVGFGTDVPTASAGIVTNAIIRNNDIQDFSYGINLRRTIGATVYNNVIRNCGIGTQPFHGRGSLYNQKHAIWVHAKGNRIANNTIFNCWNGIAFKRLYYDYSVLTYDNVIENNLIWGISGYGLYHDNDPQYPTDGTNTFRNNLTPNIGGSFESAAWWAKQTMSGNFIGSQYNPQFLNPPTDLRFSSSSPARGAGVNLSSLFTTDYYGNSRTTPWDLGAFVFNSQAPTEEDPPDPEPDPLPLISVNALNEFAFEQPITTSTFRFTRTGSTTGDLDVDFTVTGTADADVHYVALSSPVTITNGTASTDVTLTPLGIGFAGDRTVTVRLSGGDYTLSSVTNATITIIGGQATAGGYRRTPGQGPAMFRRGNP